MNPYPVRYPVPGLHAIATSQTETKMNITVTIPLVIIDQNFAADVEVSITHRSRPSTHDDPPEGCEWEVSKTLIRRATSLTIRSGEGYLSAPEWLTDMVEKSDELAEAIAMAEAGEPRGRRARDPDDEQQRMRDER